MPTSSPPPDGSAEESVVEPSVAAYRLLNVDQLLTNTY
jgi:hypothetical protein